MYSTLKNKFPKTLDSYTNNSLTLEHQTNHRSIMKTRIEFLKDRYKLTFKTDRPTGRYKAFHPSHHAIKVNGIEVGQITDGDGFKIRLQVIKADIMEDRNENCIWKWIEFKKESESLNEAKTWLHDNWVKIVEKYNIFIDQPK